MNGTGNQQSISADPVPSQAKASAPDLKSLTPAAQAVIANAGKAKRSGEVVFPGSPRLRKPSASTG